MGGMVPPEGMARAKATSEIQNIMGYVTGIVPELHSVVIGDPLVVLEYRRATFRAVV